MHKKPFVFLNWNRIELYEISFLAQWLISVASRKGGYIAKEKHQKEKGGHLR